MRLEVLTIGVGEVLAGELETVLRRSGITADLQESSIETAMSPAGMSAIVIMDLEAPDSQEHLRQLLHSDTHPPVIVLTEDPSQESHLDLMRSGVRDVIARNRLDRLPSAILREAEAIRMGETTDALRAALRHAEVRLASAYMQSPVALADVSVGGRYLRANPQYVEMMGIDDVSSLPGSMFLLDPFDGRRGWPPFEGNDPGAGLMERLTRDDGCERRIFTRSLSPVKNDDGEILFFSDAIQEITSIEKLRKIEADGRALNHAILESVTDAICAMDIEGRIQVHNRAARALLELTSDGVDFHEQVHGSACDSRTCSMALAIRNRTVRSARTALVRDVPVEIEYELSPVSGVGTLGSVIVFRDVTESNKMREELAQARRIESLGHLSRKVAHEFNNVLMGIQPFTELLRRQAEGDDRMLESINYIADSVERGQRITTEILRYARPAEPLKKTFAVREWAKTIESMAASLTSSDIELTFRCDVEDGWLEIDHQQIWQVISNLIINASDAMEGEGGSIWVTISHSDGTTAIEVRDNGKGMTPDVLDQIFEPMYTTKRTGNGLGLAVASKTIAAHDGKLLVNSTPGEGTTFTIILPNRGDVEPPVVAADISDG